MLRDFPVHIQMLMWFFYHHAMARLICPPFEESSVFLFFWLYFHFHFIFCVFLLGLTEILFLLLHGTGLRFFFLYLWRCNQFVLPLASHSWERLVLWTKNNRQKEGKKINLKYSLLSSLCSFVHLVKFGNQNTLLISWGNYQQYSTLFK